MLPGAPVGIGPASAERARRRRDTRQKAHCKPSRDADSIEENI
jgi:hypothetical protein